MKKILCLLMMFVMALLLVGCGSATDNKEPENEMYLVGKWTVKNGDDVAVQEWLEDGTIIFETGEIGNWRLKGESEPKNTLSWKADIDEPENSQTYYRVVDGDDFIKYVAVPVGDGTYTVITEVIYSGTTATFTYTPFND